MAGLRTDGGYYDDGTTVVDIVCGLVIDNDRRQLTFEQIADVIESEPKGLFA
jgi:hypothetical protein